MHLVRMLAGLALLAVLVGACSGMREPQREPARLVGPTTRAEIESVRPSWVEETVVASPDVVAADRLLEGAPAEVTVYFGTWCSDSRRELPRFWRALDGLPFEPPFTVRYIAVDRSKSRPEKLLDGVNLLYVPTFVVVREGREVGRVIEESPTGIEHDLGDLLAGRVEGVISARDDVSPPAGGGN